MRNILMLIGLCATPYALAQDECAQADAQISAALQAIADSRDEGGEHEAAVASLRATLETFATQSPVSWTCPLEQSVENYRFHAPISPDGRVRAYSWDNMEISTTRFHFSLLQYQDAQGVMHVFEKEWDEEVVGDGLIVRLFNADLGAAGTAYIAAEYWQGSTKLKGYGVSYYRLADGRLQPLPFEEANLKVERTGNNTLDPAEIRFDTQTRTLYLPGLKGQNTPY